VTSEFILIDMARGCGEGSGLLMDMPYRYRRAENIQANQGVKEPLEPPTCEVYWMGWRGGRHTKSARFLRQQ
jgi:hypothetical protein